MIPTSIPFPHAHAHHTHTHTRPRASFGRSIVHGGVVVLEVASGARECHVPVAVFPPRHGGPAAVPEGGSRDGGAPSFCSGRIGRRVRGACG